jgi:hypothetical protein
MASEDSVEKTPEPESISESSSDSVVGVEKTILRPYPKVIYFYLTWIAALVCGILTATFAEGDSAEKVQRVATLVFLWIFTFNLLVVAFEFSRMLSVAVLFFGLALAFLGLWLKALQSVFSFFGDIQPQADHQFFFFIFIVFTAIYILVFFQTRFNFWTVRKNELLHKHGFLGDVKRYHAQDVKMEKEIPDVLEYLLLRSGSIVLHPKGEDRAIVLENIIGINRKEDEVKQILESYAIRIDKS